MVFTPVPKESGMSKRMASGPVVALDCWMAALSVHCCAVLVEQLPSAVLPSAPSSVELTMMSVRSSAPTSPAVRALF
jgi:hypothetical protein